MKINVHKSNGSLIAIHDMDAAQLAKFKDGHEYEIEIKLPRNPHFHGKVMAFLRHCFEYWRSDREFMNESGQFDLFRKNLTVLAGYREEFYTIDDRVRVEAKSLSYGSMEELEFQDCYQALIQAAMTHIFKGGDEDTYNRLVGFF